MVDEKTAAADSGVESSAPQEEARIIEETVTRPNFPAATAPLEPKVIQQPQPPFSTAHIPSAQTSRAPENITEEQEAIAKILKEAKLPERHPESTPPKKQIVFDTALGASQTAVVPPQAAVSMPYSAQSDITETPAAAGKQEGLAATIVSPLRTLKNDLQGVVRLKKMSLVRAVALEQEKRSHPSEEERAREEVNVRSGRRIRGILFATGLLFALGAVAFLGVFLVMGERSGTPAEKPQNAILFAESGVPLQLEGNALELKRVLANARLSGSGTLGSITRIIPAIPETTPDGSLEHPATLEEFLRALGTRVPDELLRALADDFFFGLHTVDENAPLFVIPVTSYERAFAGMLAWEETLGADLSPVFTPVPDQVLGGGGLPEKRRFEDVVMRNYDVRVIKDDAGTIQLYYSFPTRSLLVIAESPYSFTEILSRLRAERKL